MNRPPVTVVMPFAGSPAAAQAAVSGLENLTTRPGDELILVDNRGTVPATGDVVHVVTATAEHSPAYARNVGAERATGEWILFLDADTEPAPDLLERYFESPIADAVGALAGAVVAADAPAPAGVAADAPGPRGVAAGYGAAKSFLRQDVHLSHPFMPRAAAANLLVRRAAFEQVGGFFEGVRAAEDTDFTWRLQRAGWTLVGAPQAVVAHRYRTSVRALRRQWRGYAAGRAWLGRRYDGFAPQPALARAAGRVVHRRSIAAPARSGEGGEGGEGGAHRPRRGHLALDALLGVEELAGLTLSNRPRRGEGRGRSGGNGVLVVLVADHFPAVGDPLAEYALTLSGVRVEATGRPEAVARATARRLAVDYREDDGALARATALVRLVIRHPLRCLGDAWRRPAGSPGLAALAPAVARLRRDPGARVHSLGGEVARAVAVRLAALAGRDVE